MAQAYLTPLREEYPFRGLDSPLPYDFFAVFSRFEYALKVTGYVKVVNQTRYDQRHSADWDRFVRKTEAKYAKEMRDGSQEFHDAINYVKTDKPPQKEVAYFDGSWKIRFEPQASQESTDWGKTIEYIGRVRNNLFHGGKLLPDFKDPVREKDLLEHCILILRVAATWDDKVAEAYHK